MGWTTPKTWSSEPLTSIDLNTYMRDNQNHLKDRLDSSAGSIVSGPTSLTTTSTAFVDVDAEKLALTLTTHGGDVLLGFTGTVQSSAGNGNTSFNVSVDGVDYVADDGIIRSSIAFNLDNNRDKPLSFVILIPGLEAGAHTFKLRWKVNSTNTARMNIVGLHPQFWAKEI